jgi:hypothetical protein
MGQMMQRRRWVAFLSALVACLVSPAAFAFDPTKADIEGIRLYQSKDQVIAALKKRYGPAVKFQTIRASRLLSQGEMVGTISLNARGYLLDISFAERVPPHDVKEEIVWSVSYVPTSYVATTERYHFRNSAMTKYGTPTVSPDTAHAEWCQVPKSDNNSSRVHDCSRRKPLLVFKVEPRLPFGLLMLSDPTLSLAAQDYEPTNRRKR